jgi:hypothetical protein
MTHDHHKLPTRLRAVVAAAAALLALLPSAALAADGTFTQLLCANPATGQGLGVPAVDGLSTPATANAWRATISPQSCQSEPKTATNAITLGPTAAAPVPFNGYAALHYTVTDPGLSIASARVYRAFASGNHPFEVSTSVIQHGGGDPSQASSPMNGFDSFWTGQDQGAGYAVQPFAPENGVWAEHNGRSFSVTAQCRDTGGTCNHAAGEWAYRFFGGEVRIQDAQPPAAEDVDGSVLEPALAGTESVSFRATDEGAGVYRFRLEIDDEELDARDLTTGADPSASDRVGSCFDIGPQNEDPYEFAHQQPCPAALERTVAVDVSNVSDGPHRLEAYVEDAAGNETVLVDREVIVDNHPLPELVDQLPPVLGTPAVGQGLTGENGTWHNASRFTYRWQRCATETTCTILADYDGRSYVPTVEDVGARMRFLVVAENDAGEWTTSTSPFSAPVMPASPEHPAGNPGGDAPRPADPAETKIGAIAGSNPAAGGGAAPQTPGLNGRGATRDARLVVDSRGRSKVRTRFATRTPITGRLADVNGKPIADAVLQITARNSNVGAVARPLATTVTADDGRFSYTAPGGPSRRIEVAYRASLADERPAATDSVRLAVPAIVSLRVRPARPGRTTWMTGRLRHLPRSGVQIQIQALDGRRWRTFDTTTTKRSGVFMYGYRFKALSAGRAFDLRVIVKSPLYPFARGVSPAVRVRVPR